VPNPRTFTEIVYDVQMLLAAIEANPGLLPFAEPLQKELAEVLAELRSQATRRDNLKADKQVLSREMQGTSRRALDLTSTLRALIKGTLGVGNEKLVEFLIAPRRKVLRRERKSKRLAEARSA